MLSGFLNLVMTTAIQWLHQAIVFCTPWGAFVSACAFVFWMQIDEKEHPKKAQMWFGLAAFFGFVTIGGYLLFPLLVGYMFPASRWAGFPTWYIWADLAAAAAAVVLFFVFARVISPRSNALLRRLTRRNDAERNQRTDVRTIEQHLPKVQRSFDASQYIPANPVRDGVFLGLDEAGKPLMIDYAAYRKAHVQVIGTTGFGKGIASSILLAQSLRAGEAAFVLDPKNDEWAPHVLRQECERAGVPFYLVDLNQDVPQLDFLAGMTARQLEELFIAGFSLAEKGEAADFYRLADRKAARLVSAVVSQARTLHQLQKTDQAKEAAKYAEGFHAKFEELNRVAAIQAGDGGLDLNSVVQGGGCVYFIGSMRNSRVVLVQRMLMVRLIQLAEQRDRTQAVRQMCLFLDEFKYHISRPALEGLGAARDKGVHVILAHQSLADLEDCPMDLNPNVVAGAVIENCAIRIAYRVQSPDTAEWLGKMSGEIQVDDEIRRVERNIALAEKFDPERSVRQAARYLIDVNMFLNLPEGVGVAFGVGKPQFVHIRPIKAQKAPLEIAAAPDDGQPLEMDDAPLSLPVFELDQQTEAATPEPLAIEAFDLQPINLSAHPEASTNDRN